MAQKRADLDYARSGGGGVGAGKTVDLDRVHAMAQPARPLKTAQEASHVL